MKISIYRVSDGQILRTVICPEDHIDLQCQSGEEFFLNCPDGSTYIINNLPVSTPVPVPPKSQEEVQAEIVYAVQSKLDTTAQERGYDNIHSLASYAGDPDPIFNAEGVAGKNWRSACWRYCYNILKSFNNGELPNPPTAESVLSGLPEINWPTA